MCIRDRMTTHFPQHAAHIADYSLLLQSADEALWGLSEEILSEEKLEMLFGLPVKKIQLERGETSHSGILPLFS